MTDILTAFVEDARQVPVSVVADLVGIPPARGEWQGSCPRCGGTDRFGVNRAKGAWICRFCGTGGTDGIGLLAHVKNFDLRNRGEFLAACAEVLGRDVPAEGEQETDEQRDARQARMAESRKRAAETAAKKQKDSNAFRDEAISKGRGIFFHAVDCLTDHMDAALGRDTIRAYLKARTGFLVPDGVFENLRFVPRHSHWHEGPDRRPVSTYAGLAMIAPFVELTGHVTGCHQTWIDMSNGPKFRPLLTDHAGKVLPSKKMLGAKSGRLIPIHGDLAAARWVAGEGIETVVAVAGLEGWREDTFYLATGDLGNMAGPRDPASDFTHPTLKKADSAGRLRAVKVHGPVPKADQGPDDAFQLPAHVTGLVLLADGDSEPVWTAATLARAEARLTRDGLSIDTWWPPEGLDFAEAARLATMEMEDA